MFQDRIADADRSPDSPAGSRPPEVDQAPFAAGSGAPRNLAGLPQACYDHLPQVLRSHIETSQQNKPFCEHFFDYVVDSGVYSRMLPIDKDCSSTTTDDVTEAVHSCIAAIAEKLLKGSLKKIANLNHFDRYIMRAANSKEVDHFRYKKRRQCKPLVDDPADPRSDDDSALEREKFSEKTRNALSSLDSIDQTIICLKYHGNLKIRQIAEALDCTQEHARSKLKKAEENFARAYGPRDC